MQLHSQEPESDKRLSSDEIDAILVRLNPTGQVPIDVRAHQATTVEDVAEALGVSVWDVKAHLVQWRAEQALTPLRPEKSNQSRLALIAGILFVSAAIIVVIRLRGFEDVVMDTKMALSETKKHLRPRRVLYPIENKLDLGSHHPPFGFQITVRGTNTTTTVKGRKWRPITAATATKELQAAMDEAFADASAFEKAAPPPPSSVGPQNLNQYAGQVIRPGQMIYQIANSGGNFSIDPASVSPYGEGASGIVEGFRKSQEISVSAPNPDAQIAPPSGYSLDFAGRTNSTVHPTALLVLPVDPGQYAARFALSVKDFIDRDHSFPLMADSQMRSTLLKKGIPEFSTFTVNGPTDTWKFKVPTAPSKAYPAAADALRAAEAVIRENAEKVRRQIEDLNSQAEKG